MATADTVRIPTAQLKRLATADPPDKASQQGGPFSPARLWLLSIALRRHGRLRLALMVKRLNALLYHNSLPINASVERDIKFEHHAFGVFIHDSVSIGKRVRMLHHVTLTVRQIAGQVGGELLIEDDVMIGAGAIVITPLGETMRIGRGARIGAGAIVTRDVPAGATVVSPPSRVLMHHSERRLEPRATEFSHELASDGRPTRGRKRRNGQTVHRSSRQKAERAHARQDT